MIKNERQYRISKAQAEKFAQALAEFTEQSKEDKHMHPLLRQAQIDALQSQLDDLHAQLEEYDALRAGRFSVIELESFEELPRVLIQARIASGLSQKDLADRLGLKEQQIQRYEATEYASASFDRLKEIIGALGIHVQENVFLPNAQISFTTLLRRLKEVGLDRDFVAKRLIPPSILARLQGDVGEEEAAKLALRVASFVGRVFDWRPSSLFSSTPLRVDAAAVGIPRFKKSARTDEHHADVYTVYAHYLALLVLEVTSGLPKKPIPTEASEVRSAVLSTYGSFTLENMLHYLWSLGVPVLPLNDSGAFHGACWRVEGRNIIVLKQQTKSESRWLSDILHELRHAGEAPDQNEFAVIEEDEVAQGQRPSREEQAASSFAGDVLLDGRAKELAQKCVQAAQGKLERLKAVVPKIADQENVSVDALANYMAFRLSLQGENWWGAANNLQVSSTVPWQTARDFLIERAKFADLNEVDRNLLLQALSNTED
jgi:transcriptional regulator with XRE-family HTH domain/Zn-dependent peptidase ImmA (M78 family)